jgi:hypothetical protein
MYSPKIERTIARGTTEEFDAPEKAGIKLRNIAYYPTGDRGITGDRSSKLARRLMPPKIITYLQKLAQVTRLCIPEKKR